MKTKIVKFENGTFGARRSKLFWPTSWLMHLPLQNVTTFTVDTPDSYMQFESVEAVKKHIAIVDQTFEVVEEL
jgi:hypothetical protein